METDITTSEVKKNPTLDMVMRVVKLSKLQVRALFTSVLQKPVPAGDAPLDELTVFYLLLADMLELLSFLEAEQRALIVAGVMANDPRRTGVPADPQQQHGLTILSFADSRYCTWTGQTGWTDLETGDQTAALPHPPMETIGYNLNELYRRGVLQIEHKAKIHGKHHAGSMEESRDVLERSADPLP
jgi:hypothetical protein